MLIPVDLVKAILLGARVGEEVGNDAVQTLRLTGHDLEQVPVLLVHFRDARKHTHRARNRSQRVANFVCDGRGQPSHRSQAVLHAHFALQAAYLSQIIQRVNISEGAAFRH